jgi:1-acyl-sn-glycerol-3-phosphate acyltransferase
MGIRRTLVNGVLKGVFNVICDIDSAEFKAALTMSKPLIIAINHINFLEVPILVAQSYPLFLTGIVKSETWDNPFMSFLFNTYKAIPIDRRGSYQEVFRRAREALDEGSFVAIAPEGTRSRNGVLGRGKAGVIQLALYTGAPILPVVHFGGERIWENMKRLRRTSFRFRVGRPFRLKCAARPDKTERELVLEEVMGQMARLLPEEMRGIYAEPAERECRYLDFV